MPGNGSRIGVLSVSVGMKKYRVEIYSGDLYTETWVMTIVRSDMGLDPDDHEDRLLMDPGVKTTFARGFPDKHMIKEGSVDNEYT